MALWDDIVKGWDNFSKEVSKIFTDMFIQVMVNAGKDMSWDDLKKEVKGWYASDWIAYNGTLTGGAGFGGGLIGGPWAYAAEAADIGLLLRSISRGCFGTGYILNGEVDKEEDMICIMALWTGYAQLIPIKTLEQQLEEQTDKLLKQIDNLQENLDNSSNKMNELSKKLSSLSKKVDNFNKDKKRLEGGKLRNNRAFLADMADLGIEIPAGKVAIKFLFSKTFVASSPGLSSYISANLVSKMLAKGSAKSAYKATPKFVTKVAQKGATKVAPKAVGKMSTKWVPIAGGLVASGINVWVYNEIVSTARKYYESRNRDSGSIIVINESDIS